MYACIHGIGSGFFAGVCRVEDRPLTFRDPPPPLVERTTSGVYAAMAGYAALGALQLLALARYGGATVDWSGAGGWIYLLFVLSVFGVGLYGWLEA